MNDAPSLASLVAALHSPLSCRASASDFRGKCGAFPQQFCFSCVITAVLPPAFLVALESLRVKRGRTALNPCTNVASACSSFRSVCAQPPPPPPPPKTPSTATQQRRRRRRELPGELRSVRRRLGRGQQRQRHEQQVRRYLDDRGRRRALRQQRPVPRKGHRAPAASGERRLLLA